MKKFILSCACMLMTVGSMFAVPPGKYYGPKGNFIVLVDDSGTEIYVLEPDGRVNHKLIVTSENSDGSFATKEANLGITHSDRENAWFKSDGKIHLNIKWLRYTVTHE